MTTEISFHPAARDELRADVAWLDDRDTGLGARLEAGVEATLIEIQRWPDSGQLWPGWDRLPLIRSRRVVGLPYRLVYGEIGDATFVFAVAHERCEPGYWRDRIGAEGD